MNKFRDFLVQVYDRVSSPLISSFIISWIIVNWRITIGLLFYDMEQLAVDGYTSYQDLIIKNSSIYTQLCIPLTAALGYTFVYPFIRNVILSFLSWTRGWGSTWQLKASKGSKVPMERFIRVSDDLHRQSQELENLMMSEGRLLRERDTLLAEKEAREKENQDFRLRENQLHAYSSGEFFTGDYKMTYRIGDNKEYEEIDVSIAKEGIYLNHPGKASEKLFSFKNTGYNTTSDEFIWWLEDNRPNFKKRHVVILRASNNSDMRIFIDPNRESVINRLIRR